MEYSKHDVETLLSAAANAENLLTRFGLDDELDDELTGSLTDLRVALQPFGLDRRPMPRCEVGGCNEAAEWQGWWHALDPFTREPTGLKQTRSVCNKHKMALIGHQVGEKA